MEGIHSLVACLMQTLLSHQNVQILGIKRQISESL
jgi:hypothetical protein